MPPKISTHLFTGFLGTGKTSAIRSLIAQKPQHEQWLIIVNEFGEIGIDGAVLAENGIPVAEISGGCLCCSAGEQMDSTIRAMLQKSTPQRILIEASGLAHAAGIIDELRAPEFADTLDIAAVFTLIDPRQFIDDNYAQNPLYRDQISVADVLVASKLDLCTSEQIAAFRAQAAQLFPPKSLVAEVRNAELDIAWLDTPTAEKSRYRIQALPENTLGYQSQGYTFPAGRNFDGEKLTQFFNDLPQFTQGLVRAKGVFQVLDTWVWLNWTDGQWGANQIAWRRDSRFELIAQAFDADEIERRLNDALEAE
nr:GTP-binding protein [uncultured Kingella sp.]